MHTPAGSSAATGQGLKSIAELREDKSIFRPDGLIVFPRSDGDPNHRPAARKTIPPTSREGLYDYFHCCDKKDDPLLVDVKRKTGYQIAVKWLRLSDKIDWRLADFPANYLATFRLWRPAPKEDHKHFYLYGFNKVSWGFQSPNEFAPHAIWLMRDPTGVPSNCTCRFCKTSEDKWQDLTEAMIDRELRENSSVKKQVKEQPVIPQKRMESEVSSSSRKLKARQVKDAARAASTFVIRSQAAPRDGRLPGIPVTSVEQRTQEIELSAGTASGQCEGFRKGEYVFCKLSRPIQDITDKCGRITEWPVVVQDIVQGLEDDRKTSTMDDKSSSAGTCVTHIKTYQVRFLGSDEIHTIEECRLRPALAGTSQMIVHQPLQGLQQGSCPLNLENGKTRASWLALLSHIQYQLFILQKLRSTFVVTNPFRRDATGSSAADVVKLAIMNAQESHSTHGRDQISHYMELDEDDSSARRRASVIGTSALQTSCETGTDLVNDTNTYWQGMYLGLERIWVGDVVRVRVTKQDLERMFTALEQGHFLYNIEDRKSPDVDSPFVLRIRAIYRAKQAQQEGHPSWIRVAGDVYRVVNIVEEERSRDQRRQSDQAKRLSHQDAREESIRMSTRRHSTIASAGKRRIVGSSSPRLTDAPEIGRVPFHKPLRNHIPALDERLPKSPQLPQGFAFQRINGVGIELVFSIQQLAGRFYPSLVACQEESQTELAQKVKRENRKVLEEDADSQDATRTTLSLAGLLPGCVKAMGVTEVDSMRDSHTVAYGAASSLIEAQLSERVSASAKEDVKQADNEEDEPDELDDEDKESNRTTPGMSDSSTTTANSSATDVQAPNPGSVTPDSEKLKKAGWEQRMSESKGRPYWANTITRETRWSVPDTSKLHV